MPHISTTPFLCAVVIGGFCLAVANSAAAQVRDCGFRDSAAHCFEADRPAERGDFRQRSADLEDRFAPRARGESDVRGQLIGERVDRDRITRVSRPSAYGLGDLRPGLTYARFGSEIYVIEEASGRILSRAYARAAKN